MAISLDAQRILLKAAEYIKDPEHWLQGFYSDHGPGTEERVCSLGALRKATRDMGLTLEIVDSNIWGRKECKPYDEAKQALMDTVGGYIHHWNDRSDHATVHKGFCAAVKEYCTDPSLAEEPADK